MGDALVVVQLDFELQCLCPLLGARREAGVIPIKDHIIVLDGSRSLRSRCPRSLRLLLLCLIGVQVLILELPCKAIGIVALLISELLLLHLVLLLLHLILLLLSEKLLLALALEPSLLVLLWRKVVPLTVHVLVGRVGRSGVVVGVLIGVHSG